MKKKNLISKMLLLMLMLVGSASASWATERTITVNYSDIGTDNITGASWGTSYVIHRWTGTSSDGTTVIYMGGTAAKQSNSFAIKNTASHMLGNIDPSYDSSTNYNIPTGAIGAIPGKIKKIEVSFISSTASGRGVYIHAGTTQIVGNDQAATGTGIVKSEKLSNSTGADVYVEYDVSTTAYTYFAITGGNSSYTGIDSYTITYEDTNSTEPSISANNINIAYDAEEGEIAYTINNPVTGGTVSASTTASWIILDDATTTSIPFICDANSTKTARTATVTLTYTYNTTETATKNVTITQAGNPNVFDNISDITAVNTAYNVKGTVVAINNKGFVIGDGTGYVYDYLNSTPNRSVGDMVTISGTTGSYGQIIQFTSSAAVNTATSSDYDNTPAATVITDVPDYTTGYHLSDYFDYQGTLTTSGTGTNATYFVTVGASQIQISYPTTAQRETLEELVDKTVHVTGYFTGINNNDYFTTMLESIEEVIATPHTLTVVAEDGSVEIAGKTLVGNQCEIGEGLNVTATATPDEHYTFTSWTASGFTLADATANPLTFTMPTNDATLTATFTEDPKHTATFYVQGEEDSSEEVYEGDAITFPSVTAPEGYTFLGWTTAEISGEQASAPSDLLTEATMGTADITYYAVFAVVSGTPATLTKMASGDTFSAGDNVVIVANVDAETAYALYQETQSNSYVKYYSFTANAETIGADDKNWLTVSAGSDGKWKLGDATNGYLYTSGSNNLSIDKENYTEWALEDNEDGTFKLKAGRYLSCRTDLTGDNKYLFRMAGSTPAGVYSFDIYKYVAGNATYSNYCTTVVPATVTVNIPDSHYGTYCSEYALDFSGSGVDAYTAAYDEAKGKVVLTRIADGIVPAKTGVVLYSETKGEQDIPTTTTTNTIDVDNEMVGVTVQTPVAYHPDSKYNYILQEGKFKKATGASLRANRAYLSTTYNVSASGAPELDLVFGDETTGIQSIERTINDNQYYTLDGRRVAQPTKGLYIVNGKKVVIK